ncbi:MAG: metalloregulator ArsR/SmtB family transcription factor [Pseudomonadota bacterium]
MEQSQAIAALAALAQDTRLEIIRYLVRQGDVGAPAGQIAETLEASGPRLSFHLAALERAGLVQVTKSSRQRIYRASLSHLGALVAYLLEDCCANDPSVRACCD